MITGVRLHGKSARTRWRGFGAFLATIAVALQCFLVQTHVDIAPFVDAPAHAVLTDPRSSAALGPETGDKGSAPCIMCQEIALASAFLHAAPPTLVLVEHTLSFAVPLQVARTVFARPAHSWQSRAPPILC